MRRRVRPATRLFNLLSSWLPPVLWMALIFFLFSQERLPVPRQASWREAVQIGGHLVEYAVVYLLWRRAFLSVWSRWASPAALLIGLVYAISDELHQSLLPGRHCTVPDVLVDTLGMLLAAGILAWWRTRSRRGGSPCEQR